MKLWILGQREDTNTVKDERGYDKYTKDSPWVSVYDCSHGFIVEAETESQARILASENKGDEGEDAWLNPKWSYCEELIPEGRARVIMNDFHAG